MSTVPDLVAALARSSTPDVLDSLADLIERNLASDPSGGFRYHANALRAAAERWLVDNPEPQPLTDGEAVSSPAPHPDDDGHPLVTPTLNCPACGSLYVTFDGLGGRFCNDCGTNSRYSPHAVVSPPVVEEAP